MSSKGAFRSRETRARVSEWLICLGNAVQPLAIKKTMYPPQRQSVSSVVSSSVSNFTVVLCQLSILSLTQLLLLPCVASSVDDAISPRESFLPDTLSGTTAHLLVMRVFSLALGAMVATLLTTALGASPPSRSFPIRRGSSSSSLTSCSRALESSPKTVDLLIEDYAQLIGNYSDALAKAFLADNFTDTSASINYLAGNDLDAVTFPSKAAFMASQETQPQIPLVVTTINAVTHDTIVLRWTQAFGEAALPVAGISILKFVCQGHQWKLTQVYTEFNSAVYVEDIGGSCSL